MPGSVICLNGAAGFGVCQVNTTRPYGLRRRVVDAAGFPDLWLFFYLSLMPGCQSYDLAEELSMESASAEGRTPNGQTNGAELFFFEVRGQEDLAVPLEPLYQLNNRLWRRRSHCGKRIDVRGGKSNEARSEMREARLQKCGDGRPQPEGRRKSSEKGRTQGVGESRNPVGD